MTAPGAPGTDEDAAAIYTVTYVEVAPSAAAQGGSALEHYRAAITKNGGATQAQLLQRIDRPHQLVVLSRWNDLGPVEAQATALVNLDLELENILAAPSDTRQHRGLAVVEPSITHAAAITAVTHVDVVPAEKENGLVALVELAHASRQHDGTLRFDVWQQTNRPNHFTVVEAWASRPAFDAHAMAEQTREFRRKLAGMTGALYDERLYQALP